MSTTEERSGNASGTAAVRKVDMKLEVIIIPVSDVDRSKEFFSALGWRLDADLVFGDVRIVQFTPTGSGCSVTFGKGVTEAAPGSAGYLELIVSDLEASRQDLIGRGVRVAETYHGLPFNPAARINGPDPEHQSYMSYADFEDPDGNKFLLQEITTRLPGRLDPSVTSFGSASDLAGAMQRASVAHGEHEKRIGEEDPNWPDWYAEYMAAEQSGAELPT